MEIDKNIFANCYTDFFRLNKVNVGEYQPRCPAGRETNEALSLNWKKEEEKRVHFTVRGTYLSCMLKVKVPRQTGNNVDANYIFLFLVLLFNILNKYWMLIDIALWHIFFFNKVKDITENL